MHRCKSQKTSFQNNKKTLNHCYDEWGSNSHMGVMGIRTPTGETGRNRLEPPRGGMGFNVPMGGVGFAYRFTDFRKCCLWLPQSALKFKYFNDEL